jgi:hypothetical protein
MVTFTDAELDAIMKMALRADPFDMIGELIAVKQKIQEYARSRQAPGYTGPEEDVMRDKKKRKPQKGKGSK